MGEAPQTQPFERATVSYTVPISIEGDEVFNQRLKEVLNDPERWTWTHASHRETRKSEETVADIRVGSPGPEYEGPFSVGVYYDTIYRSFASLALESGDWKP